jgi:hypothetical protein
MSRRRVEHPKPTRQQRHYRDLRTLGLCAWCGALSLVLATDGVHCAVHAELRRSRAREHLRRKRERARG